MKWVLRTIFTGVNLLIFIVLLMMFCNKFIGPQSFKWFNFIALAFPVLIIVYIILTLIWLVSWRKRGLFFLIGLLFFFNPIRRWVNYSPQKEGEGNLKLITYNIHKQEHWQEVKTFLEKQQPDVVFLQEKGSRIAEKMKLKDLPYVFEESVVAIYSKYPIKAKGQLVEDKTNGHAVFVDAEVNGKVIRFINVYLEPFYLEKQMLVPADSQWENRRKAKYLENRLTKSFELHQHQIDKIDEYVHQSPYPVVLGGDFNSVPNSYEYFHLGKALQDAFLVAGKGLGMSFYDYKFPLRIDYLFSSPSVEAQSYSVDREMQASDHYPVIATFEIK